jgi:hypothetical protein
MTVGSENFLGRKVNAQNPLEVQVITSALPDYAATEASLTAFKVQNNSNLLTVHSKLDTMNTHLTDIETAVESIDTDFNVTLSSRASESTLSSFKSENNINLNDIEADIESGNLILTSINGKLVTGTVIGDVNAAQKGIWSVGITNGSGASAVNVQDGGNSLTIDTPQLPSSLVSGRLNGNIGAWFDSTVPTVGQKTMDNSIPIVIASNQTPISIVSNPASEPGLGPYVTTNKVWSVCLSVNQASAGSNNPLLLIKNPVSSGKKVYIFKISAGINVTNVLSNFNIFIDPTITSNGSSQTIVNNYIGGSSSSVCTAFSLPTISVSGTRVRTAVCGQNTNSVVMAEDFSLVLGENHNLLITGNPSSNNRAAEIEIVWIEV